MSSRNPRGHDSHGDVRSTTSVMSALSVPQFEGETMRNPVGLGEILLQCGSVRRLVYNVGFPSLVFKHMAETPITPIGGMTVRERTKNHESMEYPFHNVKVKDESNVFTFEFWTFTQSEGEMKEIFLSILMDDTLPSFKCSDQTAARELFEKTYHFCDVQWPRIYGRNSRGTLLMDLQAFCVVKEGKTNKTLSEYWLPIALIVAQTPDDNESMSLSRYEVHPNLRAHAKFIVTTSVSIIANRGNDWWTYSVNNLSEGTCMDLEKRVVFTTRMPFFYFEFQCKGAVETGRTYRGVTQTEALMTVPMSGLRLGVSTVQAPVGKIMVHKFENISQMINTDKEAANRYAFRCAPISCLPYAGYSALEVLNPQTVVDSEHENRRFIGIRECDDPNQCFYMVGYYQKMSVGRTLKMSNMSDKEFQELFKIDRNDVISDCGSDDSFSKVSEAI